MLAYQAGIAKFQGNDVKVFAISTDNTPSQKEFAKQVNASFPMLSDFAKRSVAKEYGVLIEDYGMANRSTFVVDKDGKIVHIEEGTSALDPSGADLACSRLAHRTQQ
jgi:peroxiredoxin